jgi:anti-sigma factor RsiW
MGSVLSAAVAASLVLTVIRRDQEQTIAGEVCRHAQHLGARHSRTIEDSIQGYKIRHWSQDGLDLWAVSDIVVDELDEFVQKTASARRQPSRS